MTQPDGEINACKHGKAQHTPEPSTGVCKECSDELRRVEQQRDELLAAVVPIFRRITTAKENGYGINWPATGGELERLATAITKAQENK